MEQTTFSWDETNTESNLNKALLLSTENEVSFNSNNSIYATPLVVPDNSMPSKVEKNFENSEIGSDSESERGGEKQIDKKVVDSRKTKRRSLSLPEVIPSYVDDTEASNNATEKENEKTPKFVVQAFLNLQQPLIAKKRLFLVANFPRKSNRFSRKLRETSVSINSPLSRKRLASPTNRFIIYSPIKPVKYLTALFEEKANKNTGNAAKPRVKYRTKSPVTPFIGITHTPLSRITFKTTYEEKNYDSMKKIIL